MKRVEIYKADPTAGEVETIHIEISPKLPISIKMPLSEAMEIFQEEAEKLCDALLASLPQGTSDRLLAELLKRKASLFVFPQEA